MNDTKELPAFELLLTPGGLVGLATSFGMRGSSMVPFAGGDGHPATPTVEDLAQLRGAGLLDSSDRLDARIGTALEAVISSAAYGRVRFGLVGPELDAIVFHTASGPASLVTKGDKVRFNTRPDVEDLLRSIAQLTGVSMLRTVKLDVRVSSVAAACLMATLDACRYALLKALLDGRDPEAPAVTARSIHAWLSGAQGRAQWLTPRFMAGRHADVPLTPAAVEHGLEELAGAGLFAVGASQYACGEILMDTALRLAVLDNAATLTAARGTSGKLAGGTAIGVVRGGANSILIWENGPDGSVHIMGLSPAGLLAIAADFLGNPDALPAPKSSSAAVPPVTTGGAGSKFCAQCGNRVQPGDRFCRGCGKAIG